MEDFKFEELPKEKQDQVIKLARLFMIRNSLTIMNFLALFIASNLMLAFINTAFVDSMFFLIIACIVTDVTLLNMFRSTMLDNATVVSNKLKQILEK